MAQSSKITKSIVEAVAEYEDTSPDNLPPLAEKIDPETFHRITATDSQLTEPISFEYLWYRITVLPDREVVVSP